MFVMRTSEYFLLKIVLISWRELKLIELKLLFVEVTISIDSGILDMIKNLLVIVGASLDA